MLQAHANKINAPMKRIANNSKTDTIKRSPTAIIASIAALSSAHYLLSNRSYDLPKPTGVYCVGTRTHHLIDHSRNEPHLENIHARREIMLQIWYPCKSPEKPQTYPHLQKSVPFLKQKIVQEYRIPEFLLNYAMGTLQCHAVPNADPLELNKKFPLVFFSHGLTGLVDLNSVHIENLVSHGYIVVGISHTYDNLVTIFPNGRIAQLWKGARRTPQEYAATMKICSEDLNFVMDCLPTLPLFETFDLERIGFFGFCGGGILGTRECQTTTTIKALINMDGWNPVIQECCAIPPAIPTLLFRHDSAIQLPDEISDTRNFIPLFNCMKKDTYLVSIKGSQHRDFSDIPFIKEASLDFYTRYFKTNTPIRASRISTIINEYIVAFFDTYLKGLETTVLKNKPKYPEVTLLRK
jgi:predicted dienelactone hydrolase